MPTNKLTPDPTLAAPPDRKASRSSNARAVFLLVGLLVILCGIIVVPSARRETARREAYLPELEEEARHNPSDGRLLALLGGRLVQAGEYAPAAEILRRALATGESDRLLWIDLAAATAASGDVPRAIADLRLGLRALPDDPELTRALHSAQSLKPGTAPILFARAISPEGPEPLLKVYAAGSFLNGFVENWGKSHLENSGFTTREHLAGAQPKDPDIQRLWGLALMRNRRFSEAAAVLTQAVNLAPDSAPAYLALADCLEASGQDAQATVLYLECLKHHPKWLPALLGVGRTSLKSGINGYALTAFQQATVADPGSADAWIGLGRAYRMTGVDHAKAIAAFQKVEHLAPERIDYDDDYADALRQAVQWPAAEALLRKRLKAVSDDPLAHYLLGMVLLNNNPTPDRQKESEAETREALRLFPHNPLADIQLAQIVLSRQQTGEAIDLLTDALHQSPYNRNAMSVLARAYRQSGRIDLAEKMSKQAEQLYTDQQRREVLESQEAKQIMDVPTHEELARLYKRIGETKKATYELSMAQLLRTDPKKAAEQLKQFHASRSQALP